MRYLTPLFLLLLFISCRDSCGDSCVNDSICIDGNCSCEAGYEGEFCEIETRGSLIGFWNGGAMCDGENSGGITIEITRDQGSLIRVDVTFLLTNLSLGLIQYQVELNGFVNEADSILIPETTLLTSNNLLIIDGTGSLSGDVLTMNMKFIIQNQGTSNCVFTLEK